MEKVDDDDVQRDAAAVILARDGEHLLLRAVAELALPEPQRVLGEFGRPSDKRGIRFHDLLGRISDRQPAIALFQALRMPLGHVLAEHRSADRGIVPEEPVPARREQERHADLRVALSQLEGATLQVEIGLLILPHAVQLLPVRALKAQRESIIAPDRRAVFARHHAERGRVRRVVFVTAVILLENGSAVAVKPDLTEAADLRAQPAVCNARFVFADLDLRPFIRGARKRPVLLRKRGRARRADAEPVSSLCGDADRLALPPKIQSAILL